MSNSIAFKTTLQPLMELAVKYGAPMARGGDNPDADYTGLVYLEPILDPCPHSCGAYDYGGAYWGTGGMVYRCHAREEDSEGNVSTWSTYWRGPHHYGFTDSDNVCAAAADPEKGCGWDGATFEVIQPLGGCTADLEGGEPCDWCHQCETEEEIRGQVDGADLDSLKAALSGYEGQEWEVVSLDSDGELNIRSQSSGIVQHWILRLEGEGTSNEYWCKDQFPGGFEFRGSTIPARVPLRRFLIACDIDGESRDAVIDAPDAQSAVELWRKADFVPQLDDSEPFDLVTDTFQIFEMPPMSATARLVPWHESDGMRAIDGIEPFIRREEEES